MVSDGSTDSTLQEALSVEDKVIKVIHHADRQGHAVRQNEILENFSGDILVLLNADVLPKDLYLLENLIQPFAGSEKIGIVGGKGSPVQAETFFEEVVNFSAQMKQEMAELYNKGDNIYLCHGHVRAFSRKFADQLRLPSVVSEDAYSYLFCKRLGLSFHFEPTAQIIYRSPQNLRDHLRQSVLFFQGQKDLTIFFSYDDVNKEHSIPKNIIFVKIVKYFFKNPVLFISYLFTLAASKVAGMFTNQAIINWQMATSSKNLGDKAG